jgi:hypothetical protein
MVCVGSSAVIVEVATGAAGELAAAGVEQAAGSRANKMNRLKRDIRFRFPSAFFICVFSSNRGNGVSDNGCRRLPSASLLEEKAYFPWRDTPPNDHEISSDYITISGICIKVHSKAELWRGREPMNHCRAGRFAGGNRTPVEAKYN